MNRRWLLAVGAALVVLVLIGVAIQDLKHVRKTEDACLVVGTGLSLGDFKQHAHVLYDTHAGGIYDIGLNCTHWGPSLVNDKFANMSLVPGNQVTIHRYHYQYFPTRYRLDLHTESQ